MGLLCVVDETVDVDRMSPGENESRIFVTFMFQAGEEEG